MNSLSQDTAQPLPNCLLLQHTRAYSQLVLSREDKLPWLHLELVLPCSPLESNENFTLLGRGEGEEEVVFAAD